MTDTKFQVGATYSCRSACDYDCVWTFTVTKRTAKFLTILGTDGEVRVGIRLDYQGNEIVSPFGRYSMSPILRAEQEVAA
jgi:hypothetical protein